MSARRAKNQPAVAEAIMPKRRKKLVGVAVLVFLMLSGAGAHLAWRWYRLPARVEHELGPAPELSRSPAVLRERVNNAQQLMRERGTMLEGVSELGRLYHANGYRTEAETC